ncbi:E1-like protein-activating [Abortiporus biennis]|nr:E1-like protein-activating [Abortiporus biennis]
MPIVQFTPFSSLVEPTFWHSLTNLKIDVLKLEDHALPVKATYSTGKSIVDRESGQEIGLGCTISLGADSFKSEQEGLSTSTTADSHSVTIHGLFKNYNTLEEFKAADKTALFNQLSQEWQRCPSTAASNLKSVDLEFKTRGNAVMHPEPTWGVLEREVVKRCIWESISSGSTTKLSKFLLITFADLKKYKYYYWFAFPAFVAKPPWEIVGDWESAEDVLGSDLLSRIHTLTSASTPPLPFFLVQNEPGKKVSIAPVEEYSKFFEGVPDEHRTIAFLDPSSSPSNPGWPLRNLLTYLHHHHPSTSKHRILCWRDSERQNGRWKSRFGVVSSSGAKEDGGVRPTSVGWEKNVQGKLGPRMADLGPMMDPKRLADQAIDLNLKLMRWRILPTLDLEKVSKTKCLLLGAGTLGCYVARGLLAWGIRKITFIDNSTVSFSNPVRQPLFEFEDCLNGGRPKAACAADRLRKVFPGVDAQGIQLQIPMPGHPIPPSPQIQAQTKKDVEKLEKLIDEHDVVFLLMDSRESRWLPTVLGAAKGKIVMNAALGFDTFLVMRHGARGDPPPLSTTTEGKAGTGTEYKKLGCYYCNDIVAPADSLTDRTLDQMCTVTRPGLAAIASATAVELLVSVLQHPLGVYAQPPPPTKQSGLSGGQDDEGSNGGYGGRSVLGSVPHQLRGFLGDFRNVPIVGDSYDRCTGCSEKVIQAYENEGFDMLLKAFNEPGYLEKLTGLDKLYEEGEGVLDDVDWEVEDEDE